MKKILSILILIGLIVLNACDPMEDIYNEIEEKGDPIITEIEYTLTADDYKTIEDLVTLYTPDDSLTAQFIGEYGYFTDMELVQDYVAVFLNDRFQAQGPGSTAKITFNFNESMPEDLMMYTSLNSYTFDSDGYKEVDSLVNFAGYFFPAFNPDVYLQKALLDILPDAESGDLYKISYLYADVNPIFPETLVKKVDEGFDVDFGAFDSTSVEGPKGWYVSSYGDDTYAKMSGYQEVNEDWLIAEDIVVGNEDIITLSFTHAIKYLNYQWDQVAVLISEDYDGSDIAGATWETLEWGVDIDTSGATLGSSYDFYSSGDIDMLAYAGKTIDIAFRYLSTLENAPTWEISDVMLIEGEKIIGVEPLEYNDVYAFASGAWSKVSDVYCLNPSDYDAMGDPGQHNSFSSSVVAQDYIPNYLDNLYPNAGDGVSAIVIYDYYDDAANDGEGETIQLADKYTYTSGAWVSTYSFIEEITAQWAVSGNTNKWVFDPTETITMTNDDFWIIVNYVKENLADKDPSTYDDSENYFGSSAHYDNFDLRSGKWSSDFEDWEEAVSTAIETILLPAIKSDATVLVNGVQMYYRVVFDTYSGADGTYSMKFKVATESPATFEYTGEVEAL